MRIEIGITRSNRVLLQVTSDAGGDCLPAVTLGMSPARAVAIAGELLVAADGIRTGQQASGGAQAGPSGEAVAGGTDSPVSEHGPAGEEGVICR